MQEHFRLVNQKWYKFLTFLKHLNYVKTRVQQRTEDNIFNLINTSLFNIFDVFC